MYFKGLLTLLKISHFLPTYSKVVVMSAIKSEDVKFNKRTESKNADQTLMFISRSTSVK